MRFNLPDRAIVEELGIPVLDKHTGLIYHPVFGILYQERFRMAVSFLDKGKENILEAGFGRGLLLPELSTYCSRLFGIDVHDKIDTVSRMLQKMRLRNIYLNSGSIRNAPYKDGSFDVVVCLSVLEHINDLGPCFKEFSRVLKSRGELIIGFPVKNRLTDLLFKVIGYNADDIHPSSHRDIIEAAGGYFSLKEYAVYPRHFPVDCSLYFTGKFTKRI